MRADLTQIPPYRAGRGSTPDGGAMYKLSANELPFAPLPSVQQAIGALLDTAHRYPDMTAPALTARLAALHGVDQQQIALGAGSVEVVSQLIRALAGPGDEVIFAWRSFEAYPLLTRAAGATPVEVPLTTDHRHDLHAMRAAVSERTRLIIVCTPNNPTGTSVDTDEFDEFIDAVPPQVIVLLDEAYAEFVTDTSAVNGTDYIGRYPNVVVARTFSKAHGLAGLRVGSGFASAAVRTAMLKCAVPFGVSALAQGAAVASLDVPDELAQRVRQVVLERDRVSQALRRQGWDAPESQGNFHWLPVADRTDELTELLATRGVLVRPFGSEGIRITLGSPNSNDVMLATLGRR